MRWTMVLVLVLGIASLSRPVPACTAFCVSDGDTVLVGNNEDWTAASAVVWFEPAEDGKHGRVYFGFGNLIVQGGMNDRGLFFDYFATLPLEVSPSKGKKTYEGNLMNKVLEECATVEEALELIGRYDLQFMKTHQTMIADKTGDSAIIEGDNIIRKKGRYQVVTNFYQSRVKNGKYPCERYRIAVDMLENCPEISLDGCRKVLAATHQEGVKYKGGVINTVYSNVYDLKKGLVHIYRFHDYLNEVVLDLAEELKKGKHSYDLRLLFPKMHAAESFRRRWERQDAASRK